MTAEIFVYIYYDIKIRFIHERNIICSCKRFPTKNALLCLLYPIKAVVILTSFLVLNQIKI